MARVTRRKFLKTSGVGGLAVKAGGMAAILGDRLPLVLDAQRRAPSRFIVRVSEGSRKDADTLCAKLKAAGGACIVLRNPRD